MCMPQTVDRSPKGETRGFAYIVGYLLLILEQSTGIGSLLRLLPFRGGVSGSVDSQGPYSTGRNPYLWRLRPMV